MPAHATAAFRSDRSVPAPAPTVTIIVTPVLRHLFDTEEIRGNGGFQRLCRSVKAQLQSGTPTITFSAIEFKRVLQYATHYGEGGYQSRLRTLVAHWAAQNSDTLLS
jgi:hypothetical protein